MSKTIDIIIHTNDRNFTILDHVNAGKAHERRVVTREGAYMVLEFDGVFTTYAIESEHGRVMLGMHEETAGLKGPGYRFTIRELISHV